MLSQKTDTIDGFIFVCFTDGIGEKDTSGNLREAFEAMENIYSMGDMESNIICELFH